MAPDIRLQSTLSHSVVAAQWQASAGLAVVVGIAYFLSARLSLALLTTPDGVAAFWPAAGISAGALIALGRNANWPVAMGVVLATIVANRLGDRNLWSASVFAVCNAGEALLAAALIGRLFGPSFDLDKLSHVLGLLGAAIVATAVSGIGGALGFLWFHNPTTPFLIIWYHWFASDALGVVAVAPLLIGMVSVRRQTPSREELAEAVVALGLLTLGMGLSFFAPLEPWTIAIPIALTVPVVLWLAARCAPAFAAAAAFIVAIASIGKATFGIGLFAGISISASGRVLAAQAGALSVSLCALALAALFAERRAHALALHRHALALEKSEERLRLAVAASRMGMFDWDLRTGAFSWSDEWYRMLGYGVGEVEPSQAAWMARIHPDDREGAIASHKRTTLQPKEISSAYRIVRGDGEIRWIRTHGRFLYEGGKPVRLIGLKQDVTEARQQIETQRMLVAELQHRTRNLIAVVQSIAHQTLDNVESLTDFEDRFDHRLETLSRVQSLLSRADNEPITLRALVVMELEALGPDVLGERITVEGPRAQLRKSTVETLALAIHELLTNAIKYGALSGTTGRLSVAWRIEGIQPNKRLVLEWTEHGVKRLPSSADHARRGYGRTLIEEALPYSLSAETEFEFGADGLHCRIRLPPMSSDAGEAAA